MGRGLNGLSTRARAVIRVSSGILFIPIYRILKKYTKIPRIPFKKKFWYTEKKYLTPFIPVLSVIQIIYAV